jgi:hypothetical protein
MNSSNHLVSLSIYHFCNDHYFVFFWHSFLELTICCTTLATSNRQFLHELGPCTNRPLSEFLIMAAVTARVGTGGLNLYSSVSGASGCWCCMSWHSAAAQDCSADVNLEKNVLPEDPLGACCALLLCSSPFARSQPQYDPGWRLPPITVQLQWLGIHSVFVFSGHSPCRWPPPYHKHQGGLLAVGPVMTKVLAVVALCKASLSSVCVYPDDNMVKATQLEYLLRFYVSC